LLRLFWPVHLSAPSKRPSTRRHSLCSRTTEVKPSMAGRLTDTNATEICLKTLLATPASSRKIPFP